MTDVDAVVIGAGNAGLTAAATLQQSGIRTLLVERHNVPGGTGTSFRRGRFEFETALHQLSGIGKPGNPGPLFGVLQSLGVTDKIEFVREHDLYRSVVVGSHDVTIPTDWGQASDNLEDAFPGNRIAIEKFFELVRTITMCQVGAMRGAPADKLDPVLFTHGLRSLAEVLDEYFTDPRLKHVLGVYWTYLGLPPGQITFQDWALTFYAYVEFGPAHIIGGSQAMSTAILDTFLEHGGEVRFNNGAQKILTDARGVVGVRLDDGTEVSTRDVISNASLPTTLAMLDDPPSALYADLSTRNLSISAVVLHMGLNASPAELGFTTSTSFVGHDLDEDTIFANWNSLEPARTVGVTCYDVEPIGFSPRGASHASLITLPYGHVWDSVSPRDYHRVKFDYAQSMLDVAEVLTPGLRDAIEEVDVATPRTMARYLGHPSGAIYGYQQDRTENWLFRQTERNTHVPGLYVAGTWAGLCGFEPALESGARVARRLVRNRAA
ncbi:phytoene dehydrogenase [Mycobacterium sp. CBMA 234]|uniref:phytoene desaturase family protein n=1 Tax=Mycolicibacterium sp. CBMA 234 TaxID=1918495 RepID=UPI001390813D|nr:NAD(P)/FAD-dependent oxidoreductase [Mycolicibacterium sp. CBMA 234]MUL64596.1 phytoene dehydrogenase [Mycolicibacterium sp. CBMA 234]